MKIFHVSDLHLGKRLNEYSLIDDQKYILSEILACVDNHKPTAMLIAGDVYDKSIPSQQAVELFDYFLVELAKRKVKVFIVAGNHDSVERLSFAGRLLSDNGIYISNTYNGQIQPITLSDEYGEINFYLLPFIKPVNVRTLFNLEDVQTYTDAVKVAVDNMKVDYAKRNVLVAHQFVTNASRSGSEEVSVGGADNADISAFGEFDYIALGHIHGAQNIASGRARYSGTPLKYSFSEAKHVKSITMVEIQQKGYVVTSELQLKPLRDLVEIKGAYNDVMNKSFYEGTSLREDYVHVTLTDEEDVPDAVSKLRIVYKNLMKLDYDNARTRKNTEIDGVNVTENRTPEELFSELYFKQNNKELSDAQEQYVRAVVQSVWEEK